MRIPLVGGRTRDTVARCALPSLAIAEKPVDRLGQRGLILGGNENAVSQAANNIVRPPATGRNNWKANRGRFQQGQAERLIQGGVGEDTTRARREAIDAWNVLDAVNLRIRHRAVEIVAIDQFEDLPNVPIAFVVTQRVAIAGQKHQVRAIAKGWVLAEGTNETGEVLLRYGPCDR